MLDGLGASARSVLVRALQEAQLLHDRTVGTEHLLLGLLAVNAGPVAEVMATTGLLPDDVRAELGLVHPDPGLSPSALPLTPRLRKVLEAGTRAARADGSGAAGAEHLLIGLLEEGSGLGLQLLRWFKIDTCALRRGLAKGAEAARREA